MHLNKTIFTSSIFVLLIIIALAFNVSADDKEQAFHTTVRAIWPEIADSIVYNEESKELLYTAMRQIERCSSRLLLVPQYGFYFNFSTFLEQYFQSVRDNFIGFVQGERFSTCVKQVAVAYKSPMLAAGV